MIFKFEDTIVIRDYVRAKENFKQAEEKYKLICNRVKEEGAKVAKEKDIKTIKYMLGDGITIVYQAPRKYYKLKKEFTMDKLRFEVPEAFEQALGYESVKFYKEEKVKPFKEK